MFGGYGWVSAFLGLSLVYFYSHYFFASNTAHVSAMYAPFLGVALVVGTPPLLAALVLGFFSNLFSSMTHYGTGPGPGALRCRLRGGRRLVAPGFRGESGEPGHLAGRGRTLVESVGALVSPAVFPTAPSAFSRSSNRSSTSSSPTENRMSVSVIPLRALSSAGDPAVGGGRRPDDEGLGPPRLAAWAGMVSLPRKASAAASTPPLARRTSIPPKAVEEAGGPLVLGVARRPG